MLAGRRFLLAVTLLVPLIAADAVPVRADEADDQYAVASAHYAAKRWEMAADEFQRFVQGFPGDPRRDEAVFYLAESLLQLGRIPEAGDGFNKYLQAQPDGKFARQALFRAGEAAFLTGSRERAKEDLEQFLTKYPEDKLNAYVRTYLGQIAVADEDWAAAERSFRKCLTDFPDGRLQDDCRFGLARALEKQGNGEEAQRLYLAVAAKSFSPLADDAQFYLGALKYAAGQYDEAIATFKSFETRWPDSPRLATVRLGHGWALLKLGRPDEAKEPLRSIADDPKLGMDARFWLGLIEKSQRDWQAAAATLVAGADGKPDHPLAAAMRVHAGHALLEAGDPAAAAEQFGLVIGAGEAGGKWVDDALLGKAQAALVAKDYETLERTAAEFAQKFPQSPLRGDMIRLVGQSLLARKQFDRAAALLEQIVAEFGEKGPPPEVRYLLSLAYEGLDRPEDALAILGPAEEVTDKELHGDMELARASLLVTLKRYKEAVAPLEAYLATEPEGDAAVKAMGQLAISYARSGEMDKAKQVYVKLIKTYPQHELLVPTTEQMAEAAYDAGETAWAGKLFEWLSKGSPTQEYRLKGLAGQGWSQYNAGKLEEAAATFGKLLDDNPDPALGAEVALARGRIFQELDQPDAALGMYDLVVGQYAKTPQYAEALFAAARLRDELDQDKEAAALYERLARELPEFPKIDAVLYHWAWTLDDLKQPDEAAALFERLRAEHPKSAYWADATFRLADRAYRAGQYQQAGELAEAVLAAQAEDALHENALYLIGQIAMAQERWDDAAKQFGKLLDDYPETSLKLYAQFGTAEAAFRQGRREESEAMFARLRVATEGKTEPWMAIIHLRLAQCLAEETKWAEALEVAGKIAEAFPGFEKQFEADYVIGRALASQADFQRAREAYRRVIYSDEGEKTETAAECQFMIGESYFHQKNYEEALRAYDRVHILYAYPTWQAASLLQAGKSCEQLGEWGEAVNRYTELLDSYRDTPYAKEAAERLPAARRRAGAEPKP